MDGANQLQKGGTTLITEAAVRHAHRLLSGADDELSNLRETAMAWLAEQPPHPPPPPVPLSNNSNASNTTPPVVVPAWVKEQLDACLALRSQLREHNSMLKQHNTLLRHTLFQQHSQQLAPAAGCQQQPPSPGSASGTSESGSRSEHEHQML